jgi:hypothetical protein
VKTKPAKAKPIEDYEVMVFLIDNYGGKTKSVSRLLDVLRKEYGRSCSMERFRKLFDEYVRKYAPGDLLK